MKKIIGIFLACLTLVPISCKDELDVTNPNEPTAEVLSTEKGILEFALAGIYINGFKDLKYQDNVLGQFWGNGFFDLMADNVGAEAANVFMNQVGCPESVTLDDATVVMNPNAPSHQPDMLRQNNLNANGLENPLAYEWGYMYALNRSCNLILGEVDEITFSGDAETKKEVLQVWAYWWKGFAYSRLGSLYYAALIVDNPDVLENPRGTSNVYKTHEDIIAEAENNFSKAETILSGLTQNDAYNSVLGKIIPDFCRVGKGGILTPGMWVRNINTLRARNILMNTRASDMTTSQWDQVLALTTNGIQENDLVFTLRANASGDIISPQAGSIAARSTGDPASAATYKISERLIQAFDENDLRLANNFDSARNDQGAPKTWIGNSDRGNVFNTRWQLLDGGAGLEGVIVYSDRDPGAYELYMAGTYEENELMKAEANIYKGNVETGLTLIDMIRDYQGADLPALAGNGLTEDQAIAKLRSERRVALLFRSVAFYDARRYGVLDPVSDGGGKDEALVVDGDGSVNTNAIIDYQYLDYWDVPDNELVYNPPAAGSAEVVNPKQ
jgi:starch-binding outer membrane protein, SusD/RagB family